MPRPTRDDADTAPAKTDRPPRPASPRDETSWRSSLSSTVVLDPQFLDHRQPRSRRRRGWCNRGIATVSVGCSSDDTGARAAHAPAAVRWALDAAASHPAGRQLDLRTHLCFDLCASRDIASRAVIETAGLVRKRSSRPRDSHGYRDSSLCLADFSCQRRQLARSRCSSLTLHLEHVSDVADVGDHRHMSHSAGPRRLADMSAT